MSELFIFLINKKFLTKRARLIIISHIGEIMAKKIIVSIVPELPTIGNLVQFGAFVRNARTRLQIRIDDAASLCGVSVQLLSDLENGKRAVGLDKALKI